MFQVGDIITGIRGNGYGWTNHHAVLEVITADSGSRFMTVKLVEYIGEACAEWINIGERAGVDNSSELFEYYGTQSGITVRLDKNFNIISEGLTDDEQKDFYIALQEWKPECEGTSTEPRVQEIEERGQPLPATQQPRHIELGERGVSHIVRAQAIFDDDWTRFVEGIEQTASSERGREQAGDISYALPIAGYRYTTTHDFEERSVNMDRAGEQGRSSHIVERAQRERDRNANLDRFLGRS